MTYMTMVEPDQLTHPSENMMLGNRMFELASVAQLAVHPTGDQEVVG